MPRLFVLTTLPHSRPDSHRFERVNGRHSVGMSAPRRVGLPYGSYPRLLLAYLTTEAVRTKSPEIQSGRHAQRSGSQVRAVGDQWSPGHRASASGAALPAAINAARVEDLFGPRSAIGWHCVRDCGCGLGAQPVTTTVRNTTDMAIACTPGPGLLRSDHAFRRPRRSPSHPSAARDRPWPSTSTSGSPTG